MTANQESPFKLSPQEKQLVDAYVGTPNLDIKQAAEQVGLATRTANDILKRENVRRAVGLALLSEKKERLTEIRDHLYNTLWQTSLFDPVDLFDPKTGEIRAVKDMPPATRAAIKGVKHGRYGLELVLVDRTMIQLELLKMVQKAIGPEGEDKKSTVLDVPAPEQEA